MTEKSSAAESLQPVLGPYFPLQVLWQGVPGTAPRFPSEHSARWFIRRHAEALRAAGAIGEFRNRTIVHPGKFQRYALKLALGRMPVAA